MFGPSTPNVLPYDFISCEDLDNERECLPSPSKVATETAPPYTQAVNYFSNGIFCPAGWMTAGTAAMPVSGGPTAPPEVSGALKSKDGAVGYIGYRDHALLADALVPGETAVEYCPRLVVPRIYDLRPVLAPNTTTPRPLIDHKKSRHSAVKTNSEKPRQVPSTQSPPSGFLIHPDPCQ